MASYTGSRLRYLSLALPALLFAIVGLGAHEAQAVPRSQELDLVSRSDLYRRDTVVAPPESSFVLNGLAGQAPQTRNYDFVISEMTGAPDGFSKQMLVVNGKPLIVFVFPYKRLTFSRAIPRTYHRGQPG